MQLEFDLVSVLSSLGFPIWALVVLYGVVILKYFADGLIATIKELSGELHKITLEHGIRITRTETRLDYHDALIKLKKNRITGLDEEE